MTETPLNENTQEKDKSKDNLKHKAYWKEVQEKTYEAVKCNKSRSIISAILIVGILIIILFHNWLIGGICIGCALGANYLTLIKTGLTSIFETFKSESYFNKFFLILIALAILLTSFHLILGIVLGIGIKSIISSKGPTKKETKKEK